MKRKKVSEIFFRFSAVLQTFICSLFRNYISSGKVFISTMNFYHVNLSTAHVSFTDRADVNML